MLNEIWRYFFYLDHTWYKSVNRSKVCPFVQHFTVVYIKQSFLVGARENRERLYELNCLKLAVIP